jgi:hypothetical protein
MRFTLWLLSEALDPDHPIMRMHRMQVLDSVEAGGYEMYLMRSDHPMFPPDMRLQLAVQRSDLDFLDPDQQMGSAAVGDPMGGISVLGRFKDALGGWIHKYGPIAVASLNDRKTSKWSMGLEWMGFTVRRRVMYLPGGGQKEYAVVSF